MTAERKESNILEPVQKTHLGSLQQEVTFEPQQRRGALGAGVVLRDPELRLTALPGPVPLP